MTNEKGEFRTALGREIFNFKYKHDGCETWERLSRTLVEDVMGDYVPKDMKDKAFEFIRDKKFIPGGRYLYYAGRPLKAINNCFLLKAEEDTREDWANLSWKAERCLMLGGGIGIDYSVYRPSGTLLAKTGGFASGPIPKMLMINEIGRHVMQGGSRRSAIYASLNWKHDDIPFFLKVKDWTQYKIGETGYTIADVKQQDFDFWAPLDMTNISVNYDTEWLMNYWKTGDVGEVFLENVKMALMNGEPGFSFNFFDKENETLRNAPVSAETFVLTKEKGYVKVKDIVNVPVTLWTGKRWASSCVFKKTKENVSTVKIVMSGGREIVCDPEHEFFLENGKKVSANELKPGDSLLISLPSVDKEEFSNYHYTLGYIWGDGSIKSGKFEVSLCSEDSKNLLNYFDKSIISSINEDDGRGYIRIYGKTLPELKKYKNKIDEFPWEFVNLSFIAGLFDADGNVSPYGHIRLSNNSKEFLRNVARVLESYGILANVSKNGHSTYGDKQVYQLVVLMSFTKKFAELVPCKRLKFTYDREPYRKSKIKVVKVIRDFDIQDVYCTDVKVPEHSFMAEGVIISNCTEVVSEDDSDVCNLGSLNLAEIETLEEFKDVVYIGTVFLLCGTLMGDVPYEKVAKVREKNRRLGLGLMGIHEWLLKRGYRYDINPELELWLTVYQRESDRAANEWSQKLSVNRPKAVRAIAPTGSIGLLAGTTTGIEPVFAVAYKRRYRKNNRWHYQFAVDDVSMYLINNLGVKPEDIETSADLAKDPERRIRFQAWVQRFVDNAISSTINLPSWGSEHNNEDKVKEFANILAKYAKDLRGFTCYPDGARGGQPIVPVSFDEAIKKIGIEYVEDAREYHDVCDLTKGGVCGS